MPELSIVPSKLMPFTKRRPAVVPVVLSDEIVPELVIATVAVPTLPGLPTRKPSAASTVLRPIISPELSKVNVFPSVPISAAKPEPSLPSPASIVPELVTVKSVAVPSE